MDRREFMRLSAGAALGLLLPPPIWGKGPEVVVAEGDPARAVRAAVDALGGMRSIVGPGDLVLVKPNISFARPPEWSATTHPVVVGEVVRMCLEAGARRVVVADHPLHDPRKCIDRTGIGEALKGMKKVSILMADRERFYREVKVPKGKVLRRVKLLKALLEADKVIHVPVAKSHSAAGVSLGIKGMLGLVWDRGYFHRTDLHRTMAELATVVRADLTIVDATRALLTKGPGGPGKVAHLNAVVASRKVLDADAVAVGLAPWWGRRTEPWEIKHLAIAADMGLGTLSPEVKKVRV